MPHQCLKCGRVFEEGSTQLLKGCPDCGGNRFFFTKEPLDEKQRERIREKTKDDIKSAILELIGSQDEDLFEKTGNWVKIKPRDIRKAMEKHLSKEKTTMDKEDIKVITDENYRKTIIEKIKLETDQSDKPETIDIERPGSYKIDLKGLLEEEPIIIQKDGSYTIHLPSIFKMIDKEK
ncbi:MAG: hypothetical protein DRN24_00735 [Thermoplasmata archaeon]|nr:MAG: hypothetical protein DRN24_00735 [Thermoplasmata archaeon]